MNKISKHSTNVNSQNSIGLPLKEDELIKKKLSLTKIMMQFSYLVHNRCDGRTGQELVA